jgi:hypothetical protein
MAPRKNKKVAQETPSVVKIEPPLGRFIKSEDLHEVDSTNVMLSVDMKRIKNDDLGIVILQDGQKIFPYQIMTRLMVGWETVGMISSVSFNVSAKTGNMPEMVVRFLEDATPQDLEIIMKDEATVASIKKNVDMLKAYPFITVESPLKNLCHFNNYEMLILDAVNQMLLVHLV